MFFKNDKDKAADKVKQAQDYFKSGQLGEGLKLLYDAAKLEPDNADTFFMIGLAEQNMRNDSAAIEGFRKATNLNPNKHEAWGHLAGAYAELNRFDEAQAAIQTAVSIFQKQNQPIPVAYQSVLQGVSIIKAQHEAERIFKQAPHKAVLLKSLPHLQAEIDGIQRLAMQDPVSAMNKFDDLLKSHPDVPEIFVIHGTTVKSLGYLDMAMRDFTTAICLDPKYTEAYIQRTVVWSMIGRFADMLNDMNAVLAYDPTNIEAIVLRAHAYNIKGDTLSANRDNEVLLNADLRQHPNPALLLKQGDTFFQHKRFDEALGSYNSLLERPNLQRELLAQAYYNRSKLLLNMNRKSDSVESALKAVELMPMVADYGHGLGEVAKQAGHWAESVRGWEAYIAALKAGARGFLPLHVAENFLREAQSKL